MIYEMGGTTVGRWDVIKRAEQSGYWICRCVCGNERAVSGFLLRNGRSMSCGCLRSEIQAERDAKRALALSSIESAEKRFWKFVNKSDGCWNWIGAKSRGYGLFGWVREKRKNVYAHRFSYELHNGPFPPEMLVCHHCDNPSCVRPDHLFLGTNLDNSSDCLSKKRQVHGVRCWKAVIDEETARDILRDYESLPLSSGGKSKASGSLKALAEKYSLKYGCVSAMVHGRGRRNWRHVN